VRVLPRKKVKRILELHELRWCNANIAKEVGVTPRTVAAYLTNGLRLHEWNQFAEITRQHIKNYAVPQYDNYPNDQLTNWTPTDCVKQILKYINRFERGARGNKEALRDMLKIAHYAGVVFGKLAEKAPIYEIEELKEGK